MTIDKRYLSTLYTQADVCRAVGIVPQDFGRIREYVYVLPHFCGVESRSGRKQMRYWREEVIAEWAATTGRPFARAMKD